MSSKLFEKVLHLKIKRSRVLTLVLTLFHVIALLSIFISVVADEVIFWLLLALVLVSFVYYFKKTVLLIHPRSVISVTQTRQGDWSIRLYNGEIIDAELCDDSYKHPLLVILNFKTNLGGFNICLFPDALDEDLHRQCRRRLTLSRPTETEKLLRR